MDESDRLIAVLNGNYLAKYFPTVWYNQEAAKKEKQKGNEV